MFAFEASLGNRKYLEAEALLIEREFGPGPVAWWGCGGLAAFLRIQAATL